MARKSMTALKAQAASLLPDNTAGDISPQDIRSTMVDFMDSMTPGYCVAQLNAQTVQLTSGAAVDLVNWATPIVLTPEYTWAATTGTATCQENFIVEFQVQIDVQVGTSRVITIASKFSGSGSPGVYKARGEGSGGSDPTVITLVGLFDAKQNDTMNFTIEIDSGTNVSVDLAGLMILRVGPLINDPA